MNNIGYNDAGAHQQVEWVPVPGWEGIYEVNRAGVIRNAITKRERRTNAPNVLLIARKMRRHYSRARLVWRAFHGDLPRGYKIVHKDGDRTNCALDNLELVATDRTLLRPERWKRKTHPDLVKHIHDLAAQGMPYSNIARDIGRAKSTVYRIVMGERRPNWKAELERIIKQQRQDNI